LGSEKKDLTQLGSSRSVKESPKATASGLAHEETVIVYDRVIREYEPLRLMLDYNKLPYTTKKSNNSDTKDFMFTNLIVNGKNYGKVSTAIRSIGMCLGFYHIN